MLGWYALFRVRSARKNVSSMHMHYADMLQECTSLQKMSISREVLKHRKRCPLRSCLAVKISRTDLARHKKHISRLCRNFHTAKRVLLALLLCIEDMDHILSQGVTLKNVSWPTLLRRHLSTQVSSLSTPPSLGPTHRRKSVPVSTDDRCILRLRSIVASIEGGILDASTIRACTPPIASPTGKSTSLSKATKRIEFNQLVEFVVLRCKKSCPSLCDLLLSNIKLSND